MSRRQKARAGRVEAFWAQKQARATTPAARAQVAWDQMRATIAALPELERASVWAKVIELLVTQREICSKVCNPPKGPDRPNAQTRARAREITPSTNYSP